MHATPAEVYAVQIDNFLSELSKQGRGLPGLGGRPVYGEVAAMAGVPYWALGRGTPARQLVDARVSQLGLEKNRKKTWAMGRVAANGITELSFAELIDLANDRRLAMEEAAIPGHIANLQAVLAIANLDQSAIANHYLDTGAQVRRLIRNCPAELGESVWAWREAYQRHLRDTLVLSSDFGTALRQLIRVHGRSQVSLARQLGVGSGVVGIWATGKSVPASTELVRRIEQIFDVAPGTLQNLAPRPEKQKREAYRQVDESWWPERWRRLPGGNVRCYHRRRRVLRDIPHEAFECGGAVLKDAFEKSLAAEIATNTHRERVREAYDKPYGMGIEQWPPRALNEWSELQGYKCDELSFSNKSRGRPWRMPSAMKQREEVSYFYAWLCLPAHEADPMLRGLGFSNNSLTIAWLAVPEVVVGYLQFRAARMRQYSNFTRNFVRFCRTLLRPRSGWLWRSDHLLQHLPVERQREIETLGGWKTWCGYAFEEISDFLNSLEDEGKIVMSRDAFEILDPLLQQDDPVKVVAKALAHNRRELDQAAARTRAVSRCVAANWRNHVLISFLIRLPLRAKHWSKMTYLPDNTGHLRRTDRGWQLVLPYADFKNSANLAIFRPRRNGEELVLDFADPGNALLQALTPLLDLYIKVYWPILSDGGPYLFPKQRGGQQTSENIAANVYRWTEEYLSENSPRMRGIPGLKPFRTHSFRHIVATTLYRHYSARAAANALLVSENMILMHYGRYLPVQRLQDAFGALAASFDLPRDSESP